MTDVTNADTIKAAAQLLLEDAKLCAGVDEANVQAERNRIIAGRPADKIGHDALLELTWLGAELMAMRGRK